MRHALLERQLKRVVRGVYVLGVLLNRAKQVARSDAQGSDDGIQPEGALRPGGGEGRRIQVQGLREMRAVRTDVGGAHEDVRGQLVLDAKIPVINSRHLIVMVGVPAQVEAAKGKCRVRGRGKGSRKEICLRSATLQSLGCTKGTKGIRERTGESFSGI